MSDSPETEEIEGGRPSKRQRLSPPTNTPTTARTIISIDAGTTYGTIAVLRQSAHVPHKDITTADITYLDGYAHERSSFSQRSDATPMAIYYDPEKGGEIVWGWEVGARLEWAEDSIHQHLDHYIGQFKLLLDETKATTQIRGEIQKKVQVLKKARLIKDDDDILYHFLVKWFEFARERDLDHGDLEPEFVVCVPSAYSVHSFHRWFKTFDRAIRAVWTSFSNTAPPKIFTISEPAAAASLLMSQNHITLKPGENMLVIDGGGGTIELITYQKTNDAYVEVCQSSSASCSGNSLNEALRTIMEDRLGNHAPYLADPDSNRTIKAIVEADIVQSFESEQKKNDPISTNRVPRHFRVAGLMEDKRLGFLRGRLGLLENDWKAIFRGPLDGLKALLDEQHKRVSKKKEVINHVSWVGQFCDSDLLRQSGEAVMRAWPKKPTFIHDKRMSMTAIAAGGIFGYLNKNHSPTRFLRASFAIVRAAPRPWNTKEERQAIDWTKCPEDEALKQAQYTKGMDGRYYSFNTLEWFAQAGEEFAPGHLCWFKSTHLIAVEDTEASWIVTEQLWYSSKGDKKSWYKSTHPRNRDAAVLGTIKFDLSPLKKMALPITGAENSQCYEIELQVSVRIKEGFRHELEVDAQWRREGQDEEGPTTHFMQVDGVKAVTVNVSAAFEVTAI